MKAIHRGLKYPELLVTCLVQVATRNSSRVRKPDLYYLPYRCQIGSGQTFPRLKSFKVKFEHSRHLNMSGISCGRVIDLLVAAWHYQYLRDSTLIRLVIATHRARNPGDATFLRAALAISWVDILGRPSFSRAFRVNFSHAKHQKETCNECHQVRAGMPQRRQVTAPAPLHHHASGSGLSCMTCHNGKRAFGGDDFTVCKRCHTGTRWRF